MHALSMLHRELKRATGMHARRLQSLMTAVDALIRGRRATVSGLGRSSAGSTFVRHRIKRIDRLLSNLHLPASLPALYQWLARSLIAHATEIVIVVDWSDLTADQSWYLLRAGVPVRGRTLTVLEEVHSQRDYTKPRVHREFLKHLAEMLPAGVRVIIVTDAGFKTPWWQAVSARGWSWIGRIRGNERVCRQGAEAWQHWTQLVTPARARATELGEYRVARSRPTAARLVSYKQNPKRRRAKTVSGKRRRDHTSLKHARAEKEPWLLAASPDLHDKSAAEIVVLYRTRMQIEESFRDLKSGEFGLGMEHHGTHKKERLAILLLIAALALWVLWLVGELASQPGIAKTLRPTAQRSSLSRIRLALDWCATHAPTISAAAMTAGLLDLACYFKTLAGEQS